jgi:hypothetical protein
MSRPLLRTSISELEQLFQRSRTDAQTLGNLLAELKERSTDRAVWLQGRVAGAIAEIEEASGPRREATKLASEPTVFPKVNVDDFSHARTAVRPNSNAGARSERRIEDTPEKILSAWTALEVLSPSQPYKKPSDMADSDERKIVHFQKFQTPPWFGEGEKSIPKKRLFYQVVLGAVRMEEAAKALLAVYDDKNADRQTASGFSPVATITLDKTGRPVDEPAVAISSFAWGLPIALTGDLRSLEDWTGSEAKLVKMIDGQIRTTDREGRPIPLTFQTIRQAYDKLVGDLDLPPNLIEPPTFAIRAYQFMYATEPPEAPLLGSFFLSDLEEARNLAKSAGLPRNLAAYLGITKPQGWRDVLKAPDLIADIVAPARIPLGRWPAPGRHPLVLLQQAAVNLAFTGAVGSTTPVNGPPGTGKTTLLRDVVAALVTQRAEAMCSFDDPEQAFVEAQAQDRSGQCPAVSAGQQAARLRNACHIFEQRRRRERKSPTPESFRHRRGRRFPALLQVGQRQCRWEAGDVGSHRGGFGQRIQSIHVQGTVLG